MDRKWSAKWIEFRECPPDTAPVFRKIFKVDKVFSDSEVFISGLGAYVLRINGKRVGEDILQPAFSDYNKTVYYNTYNLNDYLIPGENTVEITLGNVWYNEQQETDWQFETAPWKAVPRVIAEFFADGNLILKTDSSWDCGESPIVFNSLRCGEHYDATKIPVFSRKAEIAVRPGGLLRKQTILPIRVSKLVKPVEIITRARYFGVKVKQRIYDFGINLSGNVELTVTGKKGDTVSLYYFEVLHNNMLPDTASLSGGFHKTSEANRFQTDIYTLSGNGTETWHSEFGYNGFRYVQVIGNFDEIELTARCFHTVLEKAGDIECDNELITKIHSAVLQSTVTNYHHMPTDCPHREKNGWTADAYISCEQAYFNFDMTHAYDKWMQDIIDSQMPSGIIPCIVPSSAWGYFYKCGPCWDAALFFIPWNMYRYTGDKKHLEKSYDAMCRYMEYLPTIMEDGLCNIGLSDWLYLANSSTPAPDEAVITIICGYITKLFEKISGILKKTDNENKAAESYKYIRNAYLKKYKDLDTDNQTIYAMELMYDFTDDRKSTMEKLVRAVESADCHITGGLYASKCLLDALTEGGRFDLAYKVAMQKDFPGWGDMVANNSGTLGEDWCGGKSGNHHCHSDIGAWYYRALAGFNIDDDAPGFRHIVLTPHIPDDLKNFSAYHITPYGKLSTSWNESEITVEIPAGTTADFIFRQLKTKLAPGIHTFKR